MFKVVCRSARIFSKWQDFSRPYQTRLEAEKKRAIAEGMTTLDIHGRRILYAVKEMKIDEARY